MVELLQEKLLAIRSSIKILKNSKGKEKSVELLDFNSSYEIILGCIVNYDILIISSSSHPKVPSLAHDVLGELLKLEISIGKSEHQLDFFIRVATALQWSSPYITVSIPRAILASLLKLAQLSNLPLSAYFKQQLLESSFFSKRSQAVLGAFMTVLPIEDFRELVLVDQKDLEEEKEGESWIGRGILRRLLTAMDREDVSQAVGKLVTKWLTKLEEAGFKDMWLSPVLESLAGGGARRRTNLGNYILPNLLVKGRVDRLRMLLEGGEYIIGGRIKKVEEAMVIIEAANKAGLVDFSFDETKEISSKQFRIPINFLSISLQHSSPLLRISAFSFLVTSKSTIAFPLSTFPLLRQFFTYNLGEEDLSETGRLLSALLTRLHDSSNTACNEDYTSSVQKFLQWLVNHLVLSLSPSKPVRLQSAIKILSIVLESGVDLRYTCRKPPAANWPLFANEGVDIVNAVTTMALLRLLPSTYGVLRDSSISILDRFPNPLPGYEGQEGMSLVEREILSPALEMIRSGREAAASSGAEIIGFFWRKWGKAGSFSLAETGNWSSSVFSGPNELLFINELLDLADIQLDAHTLDFGGASSQHPMHGTFLTLRHLFALIPKSIITDASSKSIYYQLSLRAIAIVDRVWQVTSIVLAADPMGELGVDTEEARALKSAVVKENGEKEQRSNIGGARHKIILSASWRAYKQAAELLETIFLWPTKLQDFWSLEEISSVGNSFTLWLKVIRHRGGYMAAAACFLHINLAITAIPSLAYLPLEWLENQLDLMAKSDAVSITRKSAGFRLCTLTLLSSIFIKNSTAFNSAFTRLFEIAESINYSDESRVHTMNTLEAVFLDTKIDGSATLPFLERGFLLCMSTFNSSNWILRNSALMLFGSLVTCAFSKQGQLNLPRTNLSLLVRSSLSDFFGRYPSLHSALLAYLNSFEPCITVTTAAASETHPTGLYSVLLLLSLLRTEDIISSSSLTLSTSFIPLVKKCGKSHLWKIRNAAAESLTALVQPSAVVEVCIDLLVIDDKLGENELHGRLLQVLRLLQYSPTLSLKGVNALNDKLYANLSRIFQPTRSFILQTTFLQIASVIATNSLSEESSLPLLPIVIEELEKTRKWTTRISYLPNAQEFVLEAFAFVLLLQSTSTLYQAGMASPYLGVKRHALASLLNADKITRQSCSKYVFDLIASEPNVQVQAVQIAMEIDLSEIECTRNLPILTQQFSESPSLPLRDVLTPLIAKIRNKINKVDDLDVYLSELSVGAQSSQSFESREAIVLALSELSHPEILKHRQFRRSLLTLIQDDTPSIRILACQIVSKYWNDGKPICELRGCEILLEVVGTLSLLDQIDEMHADLVSLDTNEAQLFNVERPNIFIDDSVEADFLINTQKSQQELKESKVSKVEVDLVLGETLKAWEKKFDSCFTVYLHPAPFGLASDPLISKWARRIVASEVNTKSELGVKSCLILQ